MSAFDIARAAGMSSERSGWWAAYVAMKAERGEEAITLAEALAQPVERRQADADPAQRDRLKAEIPPLLEEYVHGGSPETVLRRVVEIMGPQWRPTGEWATWIDKM